ncbi:MAG: O-antigen ligase family protein, partial [Alphaproteobacteria bacterium]
AALAIAATLAAPFAATTFMAPARVDRALPGLPTSGFHRLEIWQFVATRVAERPVLGWGFDSSRTLPGGQARPSERTGGGAALDKAAVVLPLHPHNAFLQWWLELGLPGALLGALFLALLFRALLRRASPAPGGAVMAGLIATALVIANLSYGIWQGWWQAALWFAAAFAVAALRPAKTIPARPPEL